MSSDAGFETPKLNPRELIGLNFRNAAGLIKRSGGHVGQYFYRSSGKPRFTVIDVSTRPLADGTREYQLLLSGKNPVDYLPSLYQENPFLSNFLWIFQHMQYEQIQIMDSLHTYFIPEEAPVPFLYWMAGWFGMDPGKTGYSDDTIRALLQKGLSLFQWRGTSRGLSMYLKIITGLEPEIFENTFPQRDFVVLGERSVNDVIRNHTDSSVPYFTVHFPIGIQEFNQAEKSRIATIVEQEKPVHSMYYITFEKTERKKQKGILIGDDQIMF